MSLPTFKFTSFGAPTNNESVNSGLSSSSKMEKAGILSRIREKAQDTFKDINMPEISLDIASKDDNGGNGGNGDESGGSLFSLATLIKVILAAVIIWFMWSSLSANGDFHLGMGEFGDKINGFFKSMEQKGRELISRFTDNGATPIDGSGGDSGGESSGESSDSDNEEDPYNAQKAKAQAQAQARTTPSSTSYHPPVPPPATNSHDKKPGFVNDDTKYTF